MRRCLSLALVFLLLLAGCGQGQSPEPAPQQAPAPAPTPTPSPEPSPSADPAPVSRLLMQEGAYSFYIKDGYEKAPGWVDEEWVREGNRLLAAQGGGRPYVTWLLEPDGVWRPDPKNPKVLLRYLPPTLQDGLTWRQQSGNDWVWFRLRFQTIPTTEWILTVLNRGERAEWRFSNGDHRVAVEDPSRPDEAFWKASDYRKSSRQLSAERRAAILSAAPTLPTERAPLETTTPGAFLAAMSGYERRDADLNGDGKPEVLLGLFDRRTWFEPEVLDQEGRTLLPATSTHGASTISLVTLGGRPRLLMLDETFGGALHIRWFEEQKGTWVREGADEIGPKRIGWTPATRAQLLPDGRVRVEWEPEDDPAGHRQIRHLRLSADGKVEWLDESWEPRAESLRDPKTPQELLKAFFFTQWFRLHDEAKRYFARPEMAAAFPVKDQPVAFTIEGSVDIGRVEGRCQTVKQELPATGRIPFFSSISWYEGGTIQGGTAQIGQAPDGRLVIESIEIAPACSDY